MQAPEEQSRTAPRLERRRIKTDIFGNEFVGRTPVIQLELRHDQVPESAHDLLDLALELGLNPSRLLDEALNAVSPDFWATKIDELTPLEWKLLTAIKDEQFRAKVSSLLEKTDL